MSLVKAPTRPQEGQALVGPNGIITTFWFRCLDEIWRQVAGGYVIVPCSAVGKNDIVLTPTLHKEGGVALANYMGFAFEAAETSDGDVTVKVAAGSVLKGYKNNGATQAGAGDVVAASLYIAYFSSNLDGGAGGYVLK